MPVASLTLRDQLLAMLREAIPGIQVNGSLTRRLPGNLNITIPGIDADQLIEQLPGLAISTGSACNTGQPEPSHVLTAIGLDRQAGALQHPDRTRAKHDALRCGYRCQADCSSCPGVFSGLLIPVS